MSTINANMTSSVAWVPLADPVSLEPGSYTLDSENIEVGGLHLTNPALVYTPPNGRWISRAIGGSTAASHTSGATLTRYYPEAPSGGGGVANPLTETLVGGAQSITELDPNASITGADGGVGESGEGIAIAAGSGGDFTDIGGAIILEPGDGAGTGGNVAINGGYTATGSGTQIAVGGASADGGGGFEVVAGGGRADLPGGSVVFAAGTGDDDNDAGAALQLTGGDGAGNPGAITFTNPGGPVVPLTTPGVQDVIDALVALGLVTQSD